jgi:hypothetical protein
MSLGKGVVPGPIEGFNGGIGNFRRPLLQIVVLYASDPKVVHFAKQAVIKFTDAGIDVFLNVR